MSLAYEKMIQSICEAANNLSTKDSPACQRKTSNGHIYIDDDGNVHTESDIKEILKYFN